MGKIFASDFEIKAQNYTIGSILGMKTDIALFCSVVNNGLA